MSGELAIGGRVKFLSPDPDGGRPAEVWGNVWSQAPAPSSWWVIPEGGDGRAVLVGFRTRTKGVVGPFAGRRLWKLDEQTTPGLAHHA